MRAIWWMATLTACGFVPKAADDTATAPTTTPVTVTDTDTVPVTTTITTPEPYDTAVTTTAPPDTGAPTCINPLAGVTNMGWVRVVNLMLDPPDIDLALNGGSPLIAGLPIGNTDAFGGYSQFPPSVYSVEISHGGVTVSQLGNISIVADVEYTWVLHGTSASGAIDPFVDAPCVAAGEHELKVMNYATSMPVFDVWLTEPGQASALVAGGLGYTDSSGFLRTAAGTVVVGLDTNGDAVADHSYELNLAGADWSYLYVISSGGNLVAYHHVLGDALTMAPPP